MSLLRTGSEQLDARFLTGPLRSSAATDVVASTSGAHPVNDRRLRVHRVPVTEQHTSGDMLDTLGRLAVDPDETASTGR